MVNNKFRQTFLEVNTQSGISWPSHYLLDHFLPSPLVQLGPPVVPFYPFLGGNSPTKIDNREKSRVPTYSNLSNLEDLVNLGTPDSPSDRFPDSLRFAAEALGPLRAHVGLGLPV